MLANDLKEYGKGYSTQNLYRMSKFALNFKYDEIFEQPARLIPWGTLMTVILTKSKTHEEMLFYMKETHKNGCYRN